MRLPVKKDRFSREGRPIGVDRKRVDIGAREKTGLKCPEKRKGTQRIGAVSKAPEKNAGVSEKHSGSKRSRLRTGDCLRHILKGHDF